VRPIHAVAISVGVSLLGFGCSNGDGGGGGAGGVGGSGGAGGTGGATSVTCDELCQALATCGENVPDCLDACTAELAACLPVMGEACMACLDTCDHDCMGLRCNCPATCAEICAARDLCLPTPDPSCPEVCADAIGACVDDIGGMCKKCWDACDGNCWDDKCVCP
jgi:hypothetical protein